MLGSVCAWVLPAATALGGCAAYPDEGLWEDSTKPLLNPSGPDLGIDTQRLMSSVTVIGNATVQQAEVDEGCAGATFGRTLVRFDVKTPNFGPGDLVFGSISCVSTDTSAACRNVSCNTNPSCCCGGRSRCTTGSGNFGSFFEFACPHGHIHFRSFADYRLLNQSGGVVATGHKASFCLLDSAGATPGTSCNASSPFTCGFQGIHAGCADIYSSALPCNYVDATGVPQGDYILEVTMDPLDAINESNESNNVARAPVRINVGPPPIDPPPNHLFLMRDGIGTRAEAESYYGLLAGGPFTAGMYSLSNFESDFIGTRPTASAFYRNRNELGFWREMTCTQVLGRDQGGCFVRNWASPEDHTAGTPNLGTVAMRVDRDGRTQFFAFGPDGRLSLSAALDDEGQKFLPRLCTNCHAGEYRGIGSDPDLGSIFREFEPSQLQAAPGVSVAQAESEWFALNEAIRTANRAVRTQAQGGRPGVDAARVAMESYLNEIYVTTSPPVSRSVSDPFHIPASWRTGATPTIQADRETMWREFVNPYCMTCHRTSSFDYTNYATFSSLSVQSDGRPLLRRYIEADPADPRRQRYPFMPQSKLQWQNLSTDAEALMAMEAWLAEAGNRPPVADAGTDQTVRSGSTVSLSGLASTDPDMDPLTYEWTQLAGPAVALSPSAVARDIAFAAPTVTSDTALRFRLLVRDSRLAEAVDEVTVTVTNGSRITVSSTDTPLPILDNNPTGTTSTIAIGGAGLISALQVTVNIDHTYRGDLRVELRGPGAFTKVLHNRTGGSADNLRATYTVSEAQGRTMSGAWSLFVQDLAAQDVGTLQSWSMQLDIGNVPTNRPPVAVSGPDLNVAVGARVTLSAQGSSDPDGDALTYLWQQTAGPVVTFSPSTIARDVTFTAPTVTAATALRIQLRVDDGRGGSAVDEVIVNVTPSGDHPHITVTSTDTPLDIPDNSATGITSTITVAAEELVSDLEVTVAIDHTFIGDLIVTLQGPDGLSVVLHNRTGGTADAIRQTVPVPTAVGRRTGGPWRLVVQDRDAVDVGVLRQWSMTIGLSHTPPVGTPIDQAATDTPRSIPDNNATGIVSTIAIAADREITAMTVNVMIDHPYIGDLVVVLTGPGGFSTTLHSRTGGSADNIARVFTIPIGTGRRTAGSWQLRVSDQASADIGTLRAWAVHFDTR